MDVTSMLNGSSAAAEQPKSTETKLPTRNRTPWDAGGYSLPIITHLPPINTSVSYGTSSSGSADGALDPLSKYRGQPDSILSPEETTRSLLSPDSQQRSPYESINQQRLDSAVQSPQDTTRQSESHQSLAEALRQQIPSDSSLYYRSTARKASIDSSGHYLSDSRSSLSSFTSQLSLNSTTHSRFSSTSTVSGFHFLNNGTTPEEVAANEKYPKERAQSFQGFVLASELTDDSVSKERGSRETSQSYQGPRLTSPLRSPSTFPAHSQTIEPPAESLETLARIAERRSMEFETTLDKGESAGHMPSNSRRPFVEGEWALKGKDNEKASEYSMRPTSPSDAVMIKRIVYQHRVPEKRKFKVHPPADISVFSEDHGTPRGVPRLRSVSNGHKRANSAPDFTGLKKRAPHESDFSPLGPTSEPTPPASVHEDVPSRQASMLPESPPSIPSVMSKPRCMYIADCATQSTPRKAISHILGRNKMCTRQIPPDVWVRYCRKHYQRARYRNGAGWGPLQCDLVREQINRLDIMTEENKRKGSGPMVRDWTLALRKREQNRVNALGDKKAKKAKKDDDEDDSEDEDYEKTPPGAVPEWLLAEMGTGYTSQQILKIFDRVHREMIDKIIKVMPDIELLPTMIVDQEVPREPKGYAKRKSLAHQRSQSLGGAMRMGQGHAHSMSQPGWDASSMYSNGGASAMTSQKRKRLSSHEEEPSYLGGAPLPSMHTSQRPRVATQPYSHSMSHSMSHSLSQSSASPRTSHSALYANSQHHQHQRHPTYSNIYDHRLVGMSRRNSEDYYHALPAPTPQRLSPYPGSTASQLDAGLTSSLSVPRPSHQRSHSDMGAMLNGPNHGVFGDRAAYGPAGMIRK